MTAHPEPRPPVTAPAVAAPASRDLPGTAVAAVGLIVAALYLTLLLSLIGSPLTFAVTRVNNVFYVYFIGAATAGAGLGLACAVVRRRSIATVGVALLGLHLLVLLVVLVVQAVIAARVAVVVPTVQSSVTVALGLVAALTGLSRPPVTTGRVGSGPSVVGVVAGVVGMIIGALTGAVSLLLSSGRPPGSPLVLGIVLIPAALVLIGHGAHRLSRGLLVGAAVALALAVVLQLPTLVSLVLSRHVELLSPVVRALLLGAALVLVIITALRVGRPAAPLPIRPAGPPTGPPPNR